MTKIEKAKNIMEKGWKAREILKFKKAEKLLYKANKMFEEESDWFNVTEALNHLAYNEKLKAVHHNLKGMKYAEESEKIANLYKTDNMLVLRALMSLGNSSGQYEKALKWAAKALPLFTKDTDKADIKSHIALFQLRTGQKDKALNTIEQAESLMKNGYTTEGEPHRSIEKEGMDIHQAVEKVLKIVEDAEIELV